MTLSASQRLRKAARAAAIDEESRIGALVEPRLQHLTRHVRQSDRDGCAQVGLTLQPDLERLTRR